jgi:hypothetical protein
MIPIRLQVNFSIRHESAIKGGCVVRDIEMPFPPFPGLYIDTEIEAYGPFQI